MWNCCGNISTERCEFQNICGETQIAHNKQRCTTENLIKRTQHVSEDFQWSEMVSFVCLDIEKVVNAVWRLRLNHKINSIEQNSSAIKWINSISSQKNIFLKVNFTLYCFCPTAGILQGRIIVPILELIYVSKFPQMKAPNSQFSDHFACYYKSRPHKLVQKHIQSSLNSLIDWYDSMKIKLTQVKLLKILKPLKEIVFSWTTKRSIHFKDTVDTITLGITFNPHLKWKEDCKYLVLRASSRLTQLRKLNNPNVNEETLILVYKS